VTKYNAQKTKYEALKAEYDTLLAADGDATITAVGAARLAELDTLYFEEQERYEADKAALELTQ
jgi:hypothetical protein